MHENAENSEVARDLEGKPRIVRDQEVGGSNPLAPIDISYRLAVWVGINTITRALAGQCSGVFSFSSRFLHVLSVCATVIHLDGRLGRTKRQNPAGDPIHSSFLELLRHESKIQFGVGRSNHLSGNGQAVGADREIRESFSQLFRRRESVRFPTAGSILFLAKGGDFVRQILFTLRQPFQLG
jgi:hypothetical protein